MTERKFREQMQRRIAQTCIGASAIRNQGEAGLIEILRGHFENMNLREFVSCLGSETRYQSFLNHHTDELLMRFPRRARKRWGAARKGLNLFLRDIVYNKVFADYLGVPEDFHDFNHFLRNMEVPLDRQVGLKLRRDTKKAAPRWKTIRNLEPIVSDLYQVYAGLIARQKGIARVNLDLIYWREAEEG